MHGGVLAPGTAPGTAPSTGGRVLGAGRRRQEGARTFFRQSPKVSSAACVAFCTAAVTRSCSCGPRRH
jgi:hypothetical protein